MKIYAVGGSKGSKGPGSHSFPRMVFKVTLAPLIAGPFDRACKRTLHEPPLPLQQFGFRSGKTLRRTQQHHHVVCLQQGFRLWLEGADVASPHRRHLHQQAFQSSSASVLPTAGLPSFRATVERRGCIFSLNSSSWSVAPWKKPRSRL